MLLVMGLGMNATGWWRTVPVLAERAARLAFDNRGMGRSGRRAGPYSMAQLADDAVAVLDAAGEEAAHVYGISLGGMIAQEIALRHPAASAGSCSARPPPAARAPPAPDAGTLAFFRAPRVDAARGGRVGLGPLQLRPGDARAPRASASARTSSSACATRSSRSPTGPSSPPRSATTSTAASATIRAPDAASSTASEDRMVPAANGERLAGAHPRRRGCRLSPGAGHLYFTDAPARPTSTPSSSSARRPAQVHRHRRAGEGAPVRARAGSTPRPPTSAGSISRLTACGARITSSSTRSSGSPWARA